jgi:hypothetical protein
MVWIVLLLVRHYVHWSCIGISAQIKMSHNFYCCGCASQKSQHYQGIIPSHLPPLLWIAAATESLIENEYCQSAMIKASLVSLLPSSSISPDGDWTNGNCIPPEYYGGIPSSSSLLVSTFLDRLLLLSPRTWWGIMECLDKNSLSVFNLHLLRNVVVASVLPVVIIVLLERIVVLSSVSTQRNSSLLHQLTTQPFPLGVAFVSPWMLHYLHQGYIQISSLWKGVQFYRTGRASTYQNAITELEERIHNHRAYRTRRFDVYLPPTLPSTIIQTGRESKLPAILFLPGALVPHGAYANVAGSLSDKGFLVCVVSVEPFRLAYHHLGTDMVSIQRIMKKVERQLHGRERMDEARGKVVRDINNSTTSTSSSRYGGRILLEWSLIGHSMGSFAAMKLFQQFVRQHRGGAHDTMTSMQVKKLVLWGVAAFLPFGTDLTKLIRDSDTNSTTGTILLIQGSDDELVKLLRPFQDDFDRLFPIFPSTRTEVIPGGTHDGFASYRPRQTPGGQNDSPDIPVASSTQQIEACTLTARFLIQEG